MKNWLLVLGVLAASSAFASDYKLDDPAILGEYKLTKASKESEIQKVELIYSHDNELIVYTDRNDSQYPLTDPNKDGVVFEGEDEPNCGSGDEPSCYYDSRTTITLGKTTVRGKEIPQLVISITQSDAYDDTGANDFTTVYTLNWSKAMPDAIPYYLNAKDPSEWLNIKKRCEKVVGPTDGFGGIASVWDICGLSDTVKYRETIEEAWPYFVKDNVSKNEKLVKLSTSDVKKRIFGKMLAIIKKLDGRELKVSKQELKEQVMIQQEFILSKYDLFYHYQYFDTAYLIAIDKEGKLITSFRFDTKL